MSAAAPAASAPASATANGTHMGDSSVDSLRHRSTSVKSTTTVIGTRDEAKTAKAWDRIRSDEANKLLRDPKARKTGPDGLLMPAIYTGFATLTNGTDTVERERLTLNRAVEKVEDDLTKHLTACNDRDTTTTAQFQSIQTKHSDVLRRLEILEGKGRCCSPKCLAMTALALSVATAMYTVLSYPPHVVIENAKVWWSFFRPAVNQTIVETVGAATGVPPTVAPPATSAGSPPPAAATTTPPPANDEGDFK